MTYEKTSSRLWKRLTREERVAAATTFFEGPPPELEGTALSVIVKARHLRPQVARSMTAEQRASNLAAVLEPGELLASSLLVALHLGSRRPMLGTFLDALGLAHEDGILKEDGPEDALSPERLAPGVSALKAAYPERDVETYLNTLWLQDPERWDALPRVE